MTALACSLPADGLAWVAEAARRGADCLVTPPMPGVPASGLCGLWPVAEFRLGADGGLEELKRFCFDSPGPALGYVSYHAGFHGLGLCLPAPDFPAGVFRKYGALIAPSPDARAALVWAASKGLSREAGRIVSEAKPAARPPAFPGPVAASMDQSAYQHAVRRAVEHILDGDVYQLNLSIRFETDWPQGLHPADLFAHFLGERPAMFYALYHDSPYAILSTSPERFLRVRGGRVLSQPIKGTRLSGPDRLASERALAASPKEDAELSMIVDLIRNDISPWCEYGSVAVSGHKSVFEVDGLLQMYSNVTGALRPDVTSLDLLFGALPPGSVTGCPKRRAVELIAALEPHQREAYCGAVALITGPRDLDSSVAIRTGVLDASRGVFAFHAGSGIVVDSVPELEYEETLAKAEKFLALARR